MIRRILFALLAMINAVQVLAAVVLTVYAVWFADIEQLNVGPLVSYVAEFVLLFFVTLIANAVLWVALRQGPIGSLATKLALWSTLAAFVIFWLGSYFAYAGSR